MATPNPQSSQSNTPKAPVYTIRADYVLNPDNNAGTYQLTIKATVFSGKTAVSGQIVNFEEGAVVRYSAPTDNYGVVTFNGTGNLKGQEVIHNFRVALQGLIDQVQLSIAIPAKQKKVADDKDPERLVLSRYHDGSGNFTVKVRTLKHLGAGIPSTVNIWYRGLNGAVQTDAQGEGIFQVPGNLAEGDSFPLSATVSGIAEPAKVQISRPALRIDLPERFSLEWFQINNGRAFVMICFCLILWLFCGLVGFGELPINDMTFRHEDSGLSRTEEIFNNISADITPIDSADSALIRAPLFEARDHAGSWKGFFWAFAFICSVIAFIYTLLSFREEVMEGLREGIEKLTDRPDVQSGDPLIEKLFKWAGTYSVAYRAHEAAPAGGAIVGGTQQSASEIGHSFATLLKSDILSEMIVKVVPAVFKRIF